MTHGELWYEQKKMIDEDKNISQKKYTDIKNLPKRMSRSQAVKYYNTKLFSYWMDQLSEKLSLKRKAQIISLFMFGNTNRSELFKEKR